MTITIEDTRDARFLQSLVQAVLQSRSIHSAESIQIMRRLESKLGSESPEVDDTEAMILQSILNRFNVPDHPLATEAGLQMVRKLQLALQKPRTMAS